MNKRIKKADELEVGKYYKLGAFRFIKVEDEFEGEKIGTIIRMSAFKVSVELEYAFSDVLDSVSEEFFYSEISREEFEQKLQEAEEKFGETIGLIKS